MCDVQGHWAWVNEDPLISCVFEKTPSLLCPESPLGIGVTTQMEIYGTQGWCSVGRQSNCTCTWVTFGNAKHASTTLPHGSHSASQENTDPSPGSFAPWCCSLPYQALAHKELRKLFPVGASVDVLRKPGWCCHTQDWNAGSLKSL